MPRNNTKQSSRPHSDTKRHTTTSDPKIITITPKHTSHSASTTHPNPEPSILTPLATAHRRAAHRDNLERTIDAATTSLANLALKDQRAHTANVRHPEIKDGVFVHPESFLLSLSEEEPGHCWNKKCHCGMRLFADIEEFINFHPSFPCQQVGRP
jgi:hypothetical protein